MQCSTRICQISSEAHESAARARPWEPQRTPPHPDHQQEGLLGIAEDQLGDVKENVWPLNFPLSLRRTAASHHYQISATKRGIFSPWGRPER